MPHFNPIGRQHFIQALAAGLVGPYTVRLRIVGGSMAGPFPVDRVVANDQDKANQGRGEYVVTFRVVVPEGTELPGPCDAAEVCWNGSVLFKQPLNNFRTGASHASVLYINIVLGEK